MFTRFAAIVTAAVFLGSPAFAATLSLFSDKAIASQVRGWNGLKDVSATVTLEIANDSLVINAVVNDDHILQTSDSIAPEKGDHVSLWLDFGDAQVIQLVLSPGQQGTFRPATVYRVPGKEPVVLTSTPPNVTWNETGYELAVTISLADLDLEPDIKLKHWAAMVGDTDVPPGRPAEMIRDQENALRYFVNRCHDAGLTIDLLERVTPEEIESKTAQAIRFQQKMKPRQRFDGIAYDLGFIFSEPSKYGAATARQTANKLTKAVDSWRKQFPRMNVTIQVPQWLLEKSYGSFGTEIAAIGDTMIVQPSGLSEADFNNAVRRALDLTNTSNKQFWLGVPATARSQDPENTLRKVRASLTGVPQFKGFAFDHYAGYRLMGETAPTTTGDETPRALCVRAGNGGLGDLLLSNDYFQKDFLKFCSLPFLDKERQITHLFFNAGSYVRGMDSVEILLRAPNRFDPAKPETWAEYK